MIWSNGKILPDDGLTINAADRTFEHGLGLFETLRTYNGRPTLLERHTTRMLRSASELNLPIDPSSLPHEDDVRSLLEAEGVEGDRMLRITASGGGPNSTHSVVWMKTNWRDLERRSEIFPPLRVSLDTWKIGHGDPLARHKSLNFWARRLAVHSATQRGFHETLGLLSKDNYCEGGWANLFVVAGDHLLTPSLKAPIVPGVMRRLVLELAGTLPLVVREVRAIPAKQLRDANEVFLTNSVRGISPVCYAEGSDFEEPHQWQAPGPWTIRLQELVAKSLWPELSMRSLDF